MQVGAGMLITSQVHPLQRLVLGHGLQERLGARRFDVVVCSQNIANGIVGKYV